MDTINWHHIRGLVILALIGFFLIHVVLVASLQKWRAKRRANGLQAQSALIPAEPIAGNRVGPAANQRASHDHAAGLVRHAA